MHDMHEVITPRSDQQNADDYLSGPRTIKITRVTVAPSGEQRVSVFFEGDNGKPFKPSKSMARVMVYAWGEDSKEYVGKSMTLYRDENVKWGGVKVGGIRISHMSDVEGFTIALTETRKSRVPFTVAPLKVAATARQEAPRTATPDPRPDDSPDGGDTPADALAQLRADYTKQIAIFKSLCGEMDVTAELAHPDYKSLIVRLGNAKQTAAIEKLAVAAEAAKNRPPPSDDFPGDTPIEG